ncbi:hypothetical protein ACFPB0_06790 [Glycocaulis abyssi]|uniref:Uncharacterized protein n=1 Tax=Glycocaulis abyssi TaxID=1433403 RepID=A0ABV9NBF8_9PROT
MISTKAKYIFVYPSLLIFSIILKIAYLSITIIDTTSTTADQISVNVVFSTWLDATILNSTIAIERITSGKCGQFSILIFSVGLLAIPFLTFVSIPVAINLFKLELWLSLAIATSISLCGYVLFAGAAINTEGRG